MGASGVDRFMAGAIFSKCQHLDQRLTVLESTGQHGFDEIYPAGKLTPYAMAARGPGMAQHWSLSLESRGVGFTQKKDTFTDETIAVNELTFALGYLF